MDSIFIFGLMLVLFGPKKLPEIARQAGKLMMEFRRASNDFKMQMEDELRAAEQADRQKKYEAETQAALAASAAIIPSPESTSPQLTSGEVVPTILPPSIGETVHADAPNRMRSVQADAEPEPPGEGIPVPPLEATPVSAEEFYAQTDAELHSAVELPAIANPPEHASEVANVSDASTTVNKTTGNETAVTAKQPGTEMYPDTAPMAESDQAPIHHA